MVAHLQPVFGAVFLALKTTNANDDVTNGLASSYSGEYFGLCREDGEALAHASSSVVAGAREPRRFPSITRAVERRTERG